MTRPRRLAALLLTLATPATAIEYKVDRSHSTVGFTVPIMGGLSEVTGKFSDFQVTLTGSEADPAGGHVLAIIRTGSIDTGIEKRDEDLRSDGFFDATRFPEIRFESRSIRKTGDGWEAAGPLTMHGVTRDIVLPFRFTGRFASSPEDDRPLIGLKATMSLDRRDFGIRWEHDTLATFVGDVVRVDITLLARPAPAPTPAPTARSGASPPPNRR